MSAWVVGVVLRLPGPAKPGPGLSMSGKKWDQVEIEVAVALLEARCEDPIAPILSKRQSGAWSMDP